MDRFVVVEIPDKPEILEGLKKGIYEQIGGVIRKKEGQQILAHLRDVGELSKVINSLNYKLSHITNLQYLDLGLGVLNLSATTISTLYLSKRLNEIERKIDDIILLLQEIYSEVRDIKHVFIHKDLIKALQRYEHINSFSNEILKFEELKCIRENFEESIATLSILITRVLRDIEQNPKRINELIYLIKLYIFATDGLAKVYLDFNELNGAYSKYERAINFLNEVNLKILSVNKLGRSTDKEFNIPTLPKVRIELQNNFKAKKVFKGRTLEIEYIEKNNVPFNDWKKLTERKKDNLYLVITPD